MDGEGIWHKTVEVNGIKMHVAEKGEGPVVLFIHGFPELWYSWRYQILSLAARGYRAVAPDLRGYGDTEAPPEIADYSIFHLVGDLVALIDSLGQDRVFVVGHDWGAIVAWNLCTFMPDKVKALVNLSVPFLPRSRSIWRLDILRAIYGDDFYVCRFQVALIFLERKVNITCRKESSKKHMYKLRTSNTRRKITEAARECMQESKEPGEIEAQFTQVDMAFLMKIFLTSRNPGPLIISKKKGFTGRLGKEITLPSWLSENDINYYASKFIKSGFTGGVNYYRNIDKNWELTAPWTEVQIRVPTKFIVGDQDLTYHFSGMQDYIHKGGFKRDVPFLQEVVVMEGVAHFINQEKPEEISDHIYEFIQKF